MGWYTDLVRKEAKEEAREEYTVELAEEMIAGGESVEKIARYLKLSLKEATELIKSIQNENAKNEEKPVDNEQ